MGLTHVTVTIKATLESKESYEEVFLVDTGSTDCLAPAKRLKEIGITPVGRTNL